MENKNDTVQEVVEEQETYINGEQMFDILTPLGEIYAKLDLTKCIIDLQEKYNASKDKNKENFIANLGGFNQIIEHIAKNIRKVKSEFFEIISIADGISVEEAKKRRYGKNLKVFKAILSDKELTDFFSSAIPQEREK